MARINAVGAEIMPMTSNSTTDTHLFAPQPEEDLQQRRTTSRRWVIVSAVIFFGMGTFAGAYLKSRRDKANNTVVSVNGEVIIKDGFMHRMEIQSGNQTLKTLLQEKLQMQYASKRGIVIDDAEVKKRLARLESNPLVLATAKQRGETEQDLIIDIRLRLAQQLTVAEGIMVSDAEVRDYYRKETDPANISASYYHPGSADIQAVITRSRDRIDQANRDILSGVLFESVAQKYSEDPSGKDGGWFPKIIFGRTALSKIPGFDATLMKIPVGAPYGPVKIAGTWWLIRCKERTPSTTEPFDLVRSECELGARAQKGLRLNGAKVEKDFQDFSRNAKITFFWPQYQGIVP